MQGVDRNLIGVKGEDMANSLRAKLSKLRHDGHITDAEYQAFIKKMEGHDMEIYGLGYNQGSIDRAEELQKCREYGYNKAIDEFAEKAKSQLEKWSDENYGLGFLPNPDEEHGLYTAYGNAIDLMDDIACEMKKGGVG